jgi:tetratricopeptide (TPR) repeat protein/transcriptional regulator with XRE-family HTH domain
MASARPLSFGELLRRYRVAAGLTQEELAAQAGLSPKGISDLERGARTTPRKDTVALLAEALKLSERERLLFEGAARRHGDQFSTSQPGRILPTSADTLSLLVGRRAELAALEQHLAAEGPILFLLAGEPGIGKSRLLQEVSSRAPALGWSVLQGGCHRRSGQEIYAPLLGALERALQRQTPIQQRQSLQGCAWLARLLPELAEQGLSLSQGWTLSPEQERRLMFAAVARYLANVAGPAGTLLILDDLQWAGEDALDLLTFLMRTPMQTPLKIVGAYRDVEVRSQSPLRLLLTDLAREGLARQLLLTPLAAEEARALLEGALADLPEQLAHMRQQVMQRAGGVPFFLISCAQALHTTLLEGRGNADHAGTPEVPWTVAELIRQRAAALPPTTQELLRIAAIAGRVIPRWLLLAAAVAAGHSEPETLEAVEAACQGRLLAEEGKHAYTFPHDLIRETISADLSAGRRALLHRQVAQALEAHGEPLPIQELAYHYGLSGDQEKAIIYLERAGQVARAAYALGDAERAYRDLVARLDELGRSLEAAQVREQLGAVLFLLVRYEEALDVLSKAAAIYRARGDTEGEWRALAQWGWGLALRGTPEEGLARLKPLLEANAASEATPGLAALATTMVQLCLVGGRYREMLPHAEHAVRLAQTVGNERALLVAQDRLALALLMMLRLDESLALLTEKVVPHAEAIGDLETLHRALTNINGIYQFYGNYQEADRYYEQALHFSERIGDVTVSALLSCRRGHSAFQVGDWQQARQHYEQAVKAISTVKSTRWKAFPLVSLGILNQAEGNEDQANENFQEVLRLSGLMRNDEALTLVQDALAEQELLAGQPEAAHQRLESLLNLVELEHVAFVGSLPLLAWAQVELGLVEQAQVSLEQAITRINFTQGHPALGFTRRVQARLAARLGQWTEAEAALEESLRIYRALPAPYEEAKTLYTAGVIAFQRQESAKARESLLQARAILNRLGERFYARYVEQALGE